MAVPQFLIKEGLMKRFHPYIIPSVCILMLFLSSCGNKVTPTIIATETTAPTITLTPNPCAPGNIEAEVQKVHKFMREFDDASALAANMPRDQLSNAIANLQSIRRDAEDQPIPPCLGDLKTIQIAHMNSVVNTLIAFMSGADQKSIDQGIGIARQQHDQYTVELARVLGLTMIPATIAPTVDATLQAPTPTP